jgi:tetratricopeptide (TPR) repeat protein
MDAIDRAHTMSVGRIFLSAALRARSIVSPENSVIARQDDGAARLVRIHLVAPEGDPVVTEKWRPGMAKRRPAAWDDERDMSRQAGDGRGNDGWDDAGWDDAGWDGGRGGNNASRGGRGDPGAGRSPRRGDPNANRNGGRGMSDDDVTEMLVAAQADYQDGHVEAAIDQCEEIVATYGRADARYYLAWMYQEEHLWDAAVQHYSALLDDLDYALSCYFALGQCYRAKGDLKTAVNYFDEAVDRVNLDALTRDEADQLIQLCHEAARTHDDLGNTEAADTVYNALLGFLRSRGWQDKVAEAERLVNNRKNAAPNQAPAPGPNASLSGMPRSSAPGIDGSISRSGFLTDQPPVPPSPSPLNPAAFSQAAPPPPVIVPQQPPAPGASYAPPQMPPVPGYGAPAQQQQQQPGVGYGMPQNAAAFAAAAVPGIPFGAITPQGIPAIPGPPPGVGNLAPNVLSGRPLPPLPEPQRTQVAHAMREVETYISHGLYTAAIEECLRIIEIAPQYLDVHQALAEIYVQQGKVDQAVTKYAILIDTFLVNGRVDDAVAAYRRILQLEPNNLTYRVRLINLLAQHGRTDDVLRERVLAAEAYLRMGYPDRAIEQFEQALLAAPANVALRQNYALALVRAGRVNQGISELQRILQTDPSNTLALARWHIALCSGAGTLSGAGGLASSAVMAPLDGQTRVAILDILAKLARALRADLLRGYDEVLREYLTALEASATNGDLRFGAAVVYHAANRYADALPHYQAAAATPGLDVLGRVGAGQVLLHLNDGAKAVRELEEATAVVRRLPPPPPIWLNRPRLDGEEPAAPETEIKQILARAYQRANPGAAGGPAASTPGFAPAASIPGAMQSRTPSRGQGTYSEEIYRAINEINARHPNDVAGALHEMVQLVKHYRSQRQYEQAVIVLNELTRIAPEDASVRAELAEIQISRGFLDEGLEEMRRVADIYMRHGQVIEAAQTYQQMSEIQWQMGNHEVAMNTLKQVLNLTPDDMGARMLYVQYCLEIGLRKEAAEQQTVLARYYYHNRQIKEAVAMLQQLIALDGTNYEAYDLLGQTYLLVSEFDQATRVYRHLAKINPTSNLARDRLNQIQGMRNGR